MILAMLTISFLGIIVWAHHMFTIGMINDTRAYFMSVTMIISLPTSTKIFNWFLTYLGTNVTILQLQTSTIFYIPIFLLMFTIGGSTGIILGNTFMDISLHDTYYVVTHFHFVLSLGTVIAIICGLMFNIDQLINVYTSSLYSINNYLVPQDILNLYIKNQILNESCIKDNILNDSKEVYTLIS